MSGRVEVADAEIVEAVAVTEGEMLELLARLVESPTTLGNEEPGQVLMAEAFRELAGLEPVDIPREEAPRQSFERFRAGSRTVRLLETSAA